MHETIAVFIRAENSPGYGDASNENAGYLLAHNKAQVYFENKVERLLIRKGL
ncbi:hypothetical protein TPENAI_60269 [Tenacibaculum litopenaei]